MKRSPLQSSIALLSASRLALPIDRRRQRMLATRIHRSYRLTERHMPGSVPCAGSLRLVRIPFRGRRSERKNICAGQSQICLAQPALGS